MSEKTENTSKTIVADTVIDDMDNNDLDNQMIVADLIDDDSDSNQDIQNDVIKDKMKLLTNIVQGEKKSLEDLKKHQQELAKEIKKLEEMIKTKTDCNNAIGAPNANEEDEFQNSIGAIEKMFNDFYNDNSQPDWIKALLKEPNEGPEAECQLFDNGKKETEDQDRDENADGKDEDIDADGEPCVEVVENASVIDEKREETTNQNMESSTDVSANDGSKSVDDAFDEGKVSTTD